MAGKISIKKTLLAILMIVVQCSYFVNGTVAIIAKIAICGLFIVILGKLKKNTYTIWLLVMVALAFVSLPFGGFADTSLDGLYKMGLSVLIAIAVSQYIKSMADFERTLKWFVIGGLIYFILIIIFQGPFDLLLNGISPEYTNGTTMNFTYVSIPVAVILSWCVFNRNNSKLYLVLYFFAVLMNFVSGRRKASLIPIIALFIFYILNRKQNDYARLLLKAIVVIVMAVGFIYLSINNEELFRIYGYRINGLIQFFLGSADITEGSVKSLITRQSLIEEGLSYIKANVFPLGIGNFCKIDSTVTHAHNNYIELWSTMGIGAVICFYWFIIDMLKKLLKYKKDRMAQLFIVMIALNIALDWTTTSYANVMYLILYAMIDSFLKYKKTICESCFRKQGV